LAAASLSQHDAPKLLDTSAITRNRTYCGRGKIDANYPNSAVEHAISL
jgi:hypothetical protein